MASKNDSSSSDIDSSSDEDDEESLAVSIPISNGGVVEIDPEDDEDVETVLTLLKEERCVPKVWIDVVRAYHTAANGESRREKRQCEKRLLLSFFNETEWESDERHAEDRALLMVFMGAYWTEEYARLDGLFGRDEYKVSWNEAYDWYAKAQKLIQASNRDNEEESSLPLALAHWGKGKLFYLKSRRGRDRVNGTSTLNSSLVTF